MSTTCFDHMNHSRLRLLWFAAILLIIVSSCLPRFPEEVMEDNGFCPERMERLSVVLDEYAAAGRLSGGIGYGWGPVAAIWEEAGIQGWYFAVGRGLGLGFVGGMHVSVKQGFHLADIAQ